MESKASVAIPELVAEKREDKRTEYKPKTMFQIVFTQFLEHKFAVAGLAVILLFVTVALLAPAISAITRIYPNEQNMYNRYKPPFTTLPYTSDKAEAAIKRYTVKNPNIAEDVKQHLVTVQGVDVSEVDFDVSGSEFLFYLHELMADNPEFMQQLAALSFNPLNSFISYIKGFETHHVLGTDELGRDVLIRLIYGARVSIGVGVLVAISSAFIGLLIGCLAGFYGGIVDNVLMRVTDALLSIPLMPILIIMCAIDLGKIGFLGRLISNGNDSIIKIVMVLTIFSWMTVARLVRGCILSLKEQDFILAAKTLGAKGSYIMLMHLVPNVLAPLLVEVTLRVGQSILWEAALSFLGLGIQPPTPSWGNMLLNAIEIIYNAPTLAIFPGLMILIVVISFNYLGDGLQDAINPNSIRR